MQFFEKTYFCECKYGNVNLGALKRENFMSRFAVLFIIFAAALWGVDGIVLRPSLYTLPVPLVVLLESSIVAVLLTPFFLKELKTLKQLKDKDWLALIAVAVFGGAVGTMAITKALFYVNYVNLSVVVLIQKLQPVFAISLAALLLKERLPRIFYLWAVLAMVGAYLMTFGFDSPNLSLGDKRTMAVLFALIATVSFASSTVFSKRALRHVNYKLSTYLRFLFTAIIMLIISLYTGDVVRVAEVNRSQWMIFILIVFATGGPGIFMYNFGLNRVRASVATICELAFPLTAVVLEYFVHGKVLNVSQWVGVAILIYSIIQVSKIHLKTTNKKG